MQGGIAAGAPPPAAAMAAAEAAARERDERPPSAMKRMREWENDNTPAKKHANDETRARLDDHNSRRVSPQGHRISSPADFHRRSPSPARREEQRRNDGYHPSEAAHHPQALPSMHMGPQQHMPQQPIHQHLPPMAETPKEERKPEMHEPAARKMEVDEDYDEDGEDEKRPMGSGQARNSPQNTQMNGQPKTEIQT